MDLAILLATAPARQLDPAANKRLVYLAGQLERALGARRVLFVREDGVESLVSGTNVSEIAYRAGHIGDLFPRVLALLAQNSVAPEQPPLLAPWLERLGFADRRPAPEALMILGCIVVLTAVIAAIVWAVGDSGPGPLSAEVAGPDATAVDAESDEALEAGTLGGGDVVLGVADEGGSVRGLPAVCTIDTRRGVVAPEILPCDGVGGLRFDGHRGPWHNEFGTVSPDLGVVAEAFMEAGDNVDGVALLPDVANDMGVLGARGGVERLVLVFTADGQQVVVEQPAGRGGNVATLTFGIELG
ncbi:MAG: hypothetical protein AAGK32_09925 [Actinomycetota bacterium]